MPIKNYKRFNLANNNLTISFEFFRTTFEDKRKFYFIGLERRALMHLDFPLLDFYMLSQTTPHIYGSAIPAN